MLAKFLALISCPCDHVFLTVCCDGPRYYIFVFNFMNQLEAHQAAVLRMFKQWQWVVPIVKLFHSVHRD